MESVQIKKKTWQSYGIYLLILVLLYSLLMGCQQINEGAKTDNSDEVGSIDPNSDNSDNSYETENADKAESLPISEESASFEGSDVIEEQEEAKKRSMTKFTVEPGSYLTEILADLVELGWGESVDELLQCLENMDNSAFQYWSQIGNAEERAFEAEGYIAPGQYEWESTATIEEVMGQLLSSWDQIWTADMVAQAKQQGYTVDDVLIMASIVEWESSFDPYNIVKAQVAAVVRNRIESETALQMDVTIFYLQESLEPYRDPAVYENYYDTYIRSTLPAGPIGSPSLESIQAVLDPADTEDLFFVYDEEGNYYFAEDYDQHLINCDLAGIY